MRPRSLDQEPTPGTPTIGLLSEADWKAALDRIEHEAALLPPAPRHGRDAARIEARHARLLRCLLRIQPDGEPAAIFLVATRNLSRGGISILHGTPLDGGTPVILAIEAGAGYGSIQPATVAWCRRVGTVGVDGAVCYEVGLRFDRPLNVEPLLDAA